MSKTVTLRAPRDRCRQVALFEIGGLLLITPPFIWLSGVPAKTSFGLMALIALIAACWNAVYNTSFDWVEGRLTGRNADQRPHLLRVVHALGFEFGLLVITHNPALAGRLCDDIIRLERINHLDPDESRP